MNGPFNVFISMKVNNCYECVRGAALHMYSNFAIINRMISLNKKRYSHVHKIIFYYII